jgi:hypothetical protein
MPNLHGCALGLCSNATRLLLPLMGLAVHACGLHSPATGTPTLSELRAGSDRSDPFPPPSETTSDPLREMRW